MAKDHNNILQLPSLKYNALTSWIVLGVNIAIAFFLTPAIVGHLDSKKFGIWMLVSSVVGYFSLLKLGVGTAVIRYVPFYRGYNDQKGVSETVSTAMALYSFMGLVVFIIAVLFAGHISTFFQGGREFELLLRIVGLAAALQFPREIFLAALRGHEEYIFANSVEIITAISRAITLFLCILLGFGIVAMGWSLVVTSVIALIASWVSFRMRCTNTRLHFHNICFSKFKLLFYFSLTVILCGMSELLTRESPKQIVAKLISLEAVGFYGIAALIMSYYRHAIYAMSKVFMPRFSYLSGRNAHGEIQRLFLKASKYTALLSSMLALLIWCVGPSFLQLWLNKDFSKTTPVLMILTFGTMVITTFRLSIDLLYGLGKQLYISVVAFIEGLFIFGMALILSFQYGLIGVALGVAVPIFIVRILFQVYACHLVNVPFVLQAKTFLIPWIITGGLTAIYYLLDVASYMGNWIGFIALSKIIALSYALLIIIIVLERSQREYITRLFFRVCEVCRNFLWAIF